MRQVMKEHWLKLGYTLSDLPSLWGRYLTKKGGFLERLNAFELMVAPYMIAHLRLGLLLSEDEETPFYFTENAGRLNIFLANTLESTQKGLNFPGYEMFSQERENANRIKEATPITVIIGNPPYKRLKKSEKHLGGWVREKLMPTYNEVTSNAGYGKDLKNAHNLYVYFFRWSDWKLSKYAKRGIISFITPSSYLNGGAFYGLRKLWRDIGCKILIVDLEGNSRGFRVTENVFNIQTPVAIGTLVVKPIQAINTVYRLVEGTRKEKLLFCERHIKEDDVGFQPIQGTEGDSLLVGVQSPYNHFPDLTDLIPWQHSGCQYQRTWPIAQTKEQLRRRCEVFVLIEDEEELKRAFKENRDRKIDSSKKDIWTETPQVMIKDETLEGLTATIQPYSYRAFDKSWCLADIRVCGYPRKELWRIQSETQIYFTSILKKINTYGPAMVANIFVPDLDVLTSGGKDVMPLYCDADSSKVNINRDVYQKMKKTYNTNFPPEHLHYYIYGILSHPGFIKMFEEELRIPGIKVPIPKDYGLFQKGVELGKKMIRIQTFGERLRTEHDGFMLTGTSTLVNHLSSSIESYPTQFSYDENRQMLVAHIGKRRIDFIRELPPEVYNFSISTLKPVQSWLGYRKKKKDGRISSPLDDIRPNGWSHELTEELLKLLHVLEMSIQVYSRSKKFLKTVLERPLFRAVDFEAPSKNEVKINVPPTIEEEQLGIF